MSRPRTAVVVGATNGIGKGIACRLAQEGYQIIAVGRQKEGREEEVLDFLQQCTNNGSSAGGDDPKKNIKHEFRPCNAFELKQVKQCTQDIVKDYTSSKAEEESKGIDALVMTQGMATIQKFTPTSEGNDEKLTLHFWSRAAFAYELLPALRASSITNMPGGPVVLSILSGGVHSPYSKYKDDPELKNNYSIPNAANMAGYYNDLFFDKLARQESNERINFVHAAPGFVASNWGTEMPVWLRTPIRGMQKMLGKSPEKCASYMVRPILSCGAGDHAGLDRPTNSPDSKKGLYIMKEDGTSGSLTKSHTVEAMDNVWGITKDVLKRSGIELEE